jgi:hypothetical protein
VRVGYLGYGSLEVVVDVVGWSYNIVPYVGTEIVGIARDWVEEVAAGVVIVERLVNRIGNRQPSLPPVPRRMTAASRRALFGLPGTPRDGLIERISREQSADPLVVKYAVSEVEAVRRTVNLVSTSGGGSIESLVTPERVEIPADIMRGSFR